jgi:CRP-like cAMP-binding protein
MLIVSQRALAGEVTVTAGCGETLFWEGDPCAHVLELRSGIVRGVSVSEDGERQVTAFFFAGDQIGIPVTTSYRYSAEAISRVSYVSHPRGRWCDSMIESLRSDGQLLQSIGAEQDPVFRRGMLIGRNGALARIAAFLTSIADRLEPVGDGLHFPVPQRDIAAYLAMTPETVCRSLKRLREMGVIEMPSHDRLIVNDRSRLELAAHSQVDA